MGVKEYVMPDVYRTMILDAADAPLGRSIANMFANSDQHMWQTGLSADGRSPATHYISTGYVPEGYQIMAPCQWWEQDPETGQWVKTNSYPGRPDIVFAACQQPIPGTEPPQPAVPCTLEEVEGAFARADMTAQDPFVAMGRLGLQIVQPEPEVDVPLDLAQEPA